MEKITKDNPKILFTIPTLNGGGAEKVFTTYIRTLDPSIWDINLLMIKQTGVFLNLIPSHVKIYDLDKKRTRYSFLKLLRYIKLIQPDLIVSTSNYFNILLLFTSYFYKNNIKICLYEPSMPSAQFGNKYLPRYYLWLMKLLYRKSDYIIAQTDEMKSEIEKYYSSPINEIIVTINPIDTRDIKNKIESSSNPYNNNEINIVVSGRIREEKGQDFLIESFSRVVNKNSKFKLYILGNVGNEEYYKNLISLIKELNVGKNVEFLGFKDNPYPYYKYADLLVLPSRWEGLPNVVLEALYLQTPVVVTNCIPFFKRFLKQDKNGIIVEFGDTKQLADAILNYDSLIVERNDIPLVNMSKIFSEMI